MPHLIVRPAATDDHDAVMAISATVWDGHDYLPYVWDTWISEANTDGYLDVAVSNGVVVGIQHTAIQANGVAWMEGIRVHPDYRLQGIAARMLEATIERARSIGCGRARLSTGEGNVGSRKVATSHGFKEVARFHIFRATPDGNASGEVSREPISAESLVGLRHRLGIAQTLIVNQWTAYDLPDQLPPEGLPYHFSLRSDGKIEALALATDSRDGTELSIACMEGNPGSVERLGLAIRRMAHDKESAGVFGMLPERAEIFEGMRRAGFEKDVDLITLVFELNLTT